MSRPDVYIFGAGGIGSFLTVALAPRHKIYICDFDRVEPKNTANQIYLKGDAGMKKVDVIGQLYGKENVVPVDDDAKMFKLIMKNTNDARIIILATDSLGTRKKILEGIKDIRNPSYMSTFIIDARTNASMSNVYVFGCQRIPQYIKKLDEEIKMIESMSETGDKPTSCRTRGEADVDNTSGMRTALMVFKEIETSYSKYGYDPSRIITFIRNKFSVGEISWTE